MPPTRLEHIFSPRFELGFRPRCVSSCQLYEAVTQIVIIRRFRASLTQWSMTSFRINSKRLCIHGPAISTTKPSAYASTRILYGHAYGTYSSHDSYSSISTLSCIDRTARRARAGLIMSLFRIERHMHSSCCICVMTSSGYSRSLSICVDYDFRLSDGANLRL
jgi:hypothetical protein